MVSVLITGASDGIGRALVECYRQKGATVIAHGRRPADRITPRLPAQVTYVQSDLAQDVTPIADACPTQLDLAILNAGVGWVARPQDTPSDKIDDMIRINLTAQLELAHMLYPKLVQGHGKLVFIGSTAARGAQPEFSVYAATKAALAGAARSLRIEWDGKVDVQIIHPGPTATAMHDKAGLGDIAARRLFTAPHTVAQSIDTAIARGKPVARFGPAFMLRHAILARFQ